MCFAGGSGTAVVRLKAIDGTLSSAEHCTVLNLPQRSAPKADIRFSLLQCIIASNRDPLY